MRTRLIAAAMAWDCNCVFTADPQNGFEQAILRAMIEQALTKVHQNAGVKAWIIHWQRKRIFPIQPPSHHLCRLTVGAVFHRLLRCVEQAKGEQGMRDRCLILSLYYTEDYELGS